MFSPFYAAARRRGSADPERHCSLNVAVYGQTAERWSFTEHRRDAVSREPERWRVAGNELRWEGEDLVIGIDDWSAPLGLRGRVRGQVRVTPTRINDRSFRIDPEGLHRWWPIAPHGRARVELDSPQLRFEGSAYLDSNWGDEPMEAGFSTWTWSRAEVGDATVVLYDAAPRRGPAYERAMRFGREGLEYLDGSAFEWTSLPQGGWGMERKTRVSRGGDAQLLRTLEDAPFYTRNLMKTRVLGEEVRAVHESLDLDRWARPRTQFMLPFRMRKRR